MIEVFEPPLYLAWRWEHGMPYVVHFYVTKDRRSLSMARSCVKWMCAYFGEQGFTHILLNAMECDPRVQKAIEYYFKVHSYAVEDEHKFYMVEV